MSEVVALDSCQDLTNTLGFNTFKHAEWEQDGFSFSYRGSNDEVRKLHVKKDGKKIFSDFGEMVFTAKGISGPLVLSASCHIKDKEIQQYKIK